MRAVAAIPTVGLLAGSALGVLLPALPLPTAFIVLLLSAACAFRGWQQSRPAMLAAFVALTFAAGGAILAIDAWQAAWRPSLRVAFEALAGAQREEAARDGRALPVDDSASAIVTGVLRLDAAPRPNGVSLSLDVISIRGHGPPVGVADLSGDVAPLSMSGMDRTAGESARPDPPDQGRDAPVRGGVLLTVAGTLASERMHDWRAGRTIRAPAQLRRPTRYLNPGVADEERSLARRGITLVGSVKSGALVEVVHEGGWGSEAAGDARAFTRRAVAAAVARWGRRSPGVVTAILIGDRAGLDDDLERKLQEAGTYHVIAISGGNIAILAGLAVGMFRLAGFLGRTAMLGAIAVLLAYAYLVGGGASVNRATLMAVVYCGARAIDLRGPPFNVLALSAGLLVAAHPLAIVDPGFLLTFGATTAILMAVPAWQPRTLPRPLALVTAMLLASAAAEAALIPISALLFSRVTVAGLALNFAAIPLMGVVQIAGLVTVATFPFSVTLASAAGWVAHTAAEGLVRSADLVTIAPVLTWRVAPPHWSAIAAYYLGLSVAWVLWSGRFAAVARLFPGREHLVRRVQWSGVAFVLAAGIPIAAGPWMPTDRPARGRLRVTFLDVGQGDAAFVQFPRGASMVVDAGGLTSASTFDVGDRVVAPAVRRAGVRRLDTVAVTHGDLDHAGGVASIVREFRPRQVWEGIPVPPLPVLREVRSIADQVGAQWANVQAGDLVVIDDVRVAVRHPRPPDWERQDVRNDDSIVVELLWRDVSIVLTGDIGRDAEREIAPLFSISPLRLVKVPHHGSLTSSSREFVRALAPRVAVISAGRSNTFGHPAPAVLRTYRETGAHVFRTDQDGAITVDTDGHSLDVRTFTGQRLFIPG
jgi:competence protein ComEC